MWTRLPEVPMMVIVNGPAAAVLDAVRVRMLVVVVLAGLKDGGEGVLGDANYLRRTDAEIFAKQAALRVSS